MDPLLVLADRLQQTGQQDVSILLLRVFIQAVQAPNNHHLTAAAAQQLGDLARQILDNLR